MKALKVLSLFDGISCGMVALERAEIPVERYAAYEIEEDAIKVSKYNYPQIEHKGDVFKAEYTEGEFDILIGGSPCTYWSIARHPKTEHKRETSSSGLGWELFMEYVRALREVKPKWFLYENNESISSEIKEEITRELGVEPVMINSADFSAQIRKRCYWTNIPINEWEQKHIVFSDIMDSKGQFLTRSIDKYADTIKWSKDNMTVKWDTSGKGYYSQASRAKLPEQKWGTVCANRAESKGNVWLGNNTIRLVTMAELEKLQTLPVGYTSCLKNKEKRGKCIGNGWTVDVIAHIFTSLKEERK
jgi:DNA (cytosine-5)-methyltransferase 3A